MSHSGSRPITYEGPAGRLRSDPWVRTRSGAVPPKGTFRPRANSRAIHVKVKRFFSELLPGFRRYGGASHCRAASAVRRPGQMTTFWLNQPRRGGDGRPSRSVSQCPRCVNPARGGRLTLLPLLACQPVGLEGNGITLAGHPGHVSGTAPSSGPMGPLRQGPSRPRRQLNRDSSETQFAHATIREGKDTAVSGFMRGVLCTDGAGQHSAGLEMRNPGGRPWHRIQM